MSIDPKFPTLVVDEYTSPIDVSVSPSASIAECIEIMETSGYRHLPVIEGGAAVGIISQRDLSVFKSFSAKEQTHALRAGSIMRTSPYIVNHNESLERVAFQLSSRKIGSALVRDETGSVSGIFTTTDALNALIEILHAQNMASPE